MTGACMRQYQPVRAGVVCLSTQRLLRKAIARKEMPPPWLKGGGNPMLKEISPSGMAEILSFF
jgi:hypothetical protein